MGRLARPRGLLAADLTKRAAEPKSAKETLCLQRTTRRLAVLGGVTALGSLFYVLFVPRSDEAEIRANLAELARAIAWDAGTEIESVRNQRIEQSFSRLLTPGVVAQFLDLPRLEPGRSELSLKARSLRRRYDRFEVSLSDVTVHLDRQNRSAYLVGNATITTEQKGELNQHGRRFSAHWIERGNWQISALDVQAPTHDEPEARP